jgi:hypothetical protein
MLRRLLLPLFVLALVLAMPRPAAAQPRCFSILAPCATGLSAPWGAADFGAPKPAVTVKFVTRSQSSQGRVPATAHSVSAFSELGHAFFSHGRAPGTSNQLAVEHQMPGFSTVLSNR